MTAHVIDELVLKISVDAKDAEKGSKQAQAMVDREEKKLKDADDKQAKRRKARISETKNELQAVKNLAAGLRGLAGAAGAIIAAGVGAIAALSGVEQTARRAAVGTGATTRELQAAGTAMARLGGNAESGRAAWASLAREMKQFHMTGQAPTLQAFAMAGARVSPDMKPEDALANMQQTYRQASPAQKNEIEGRLSAMGVSDDLIIAIKSEKDVREEFAKSFSEAATENRRGLDAFASAVESAKNAALNVANTLLSVVQPQIEALAKWLTVGTSGLSAFADKVQAAGGGIDGLQKVLDTEAPQLGEVLHGITTGLRIFGEAVDLVAYGVKLVADKVKALFGGDKNIQQGVENVEKWTKPLVDGVKNLWADLEKRWPKAVSVARAQGPDIVGGMLGDHGGKSVATVAAPGAKPTAQEFMSYVSSKYGASPEQAAALWGNIMQESTGNPASLNPRSGAAGLFQLLSKDRVAAFRAFAGTTADKAPWQTQADFVFTNQEERRRLYRGFGVGGGVTGMTEGVMRYYEAPGALEANLPRRLAAAQSAIGQYGGAQSVNSSSNAAPGQQININGPINVQANNPSDFVGGITRVASVQNYQAGNR